MANKKELLDNAFNEAISTVPYNGMDPQTAAETIKVAMQNIASVTITISQTMRQSNHHRGF